jgi:MarR family transcriptional regulator, organic hydroperoxide resistance regulator
MNTQNQEINKLLIQLSRQHFIRLHSLMEDIGLYRGQPPLLHELWRREGCTQTELAEVMCVAPATVTNMLQHMEESGMVERKPDAADQRVMRVYLTPAGRDIQAVVVERENQVGLELLDGFTPEETSLLGGLMTRMRDNLQKINRDLPEPEREGGRGGRYHGHKGRGHHPEHPDREREN